MPGTDSEARSAPDVTFGGMTPSPYGEGQAQGEAAGARVVSSPAPTHNDETKRILSPRRRELMLRAMDGHDELAGLMHCLHQYRFCDNFLIWLICHHYTGRVLADLLVNRFQRSVPALVEFLVLQCNRKSGDRFSDLKIPLPPLPPRWRPGQA